MLRDRRERLPPLLQQHPTVIFISCLCTLLCSPAHSQPLVDRQDDLTGTSDHLLAEIPAYSTVLFVKTAGLDGLGVEFCFWHQGRLEHRDATLKEVLSAALEGRLGENCQ